MLGGKGCDGGSKHGWWMFERWRDRGCVITLGEEYFGIIGSGCKDSGKEPVGRKTVKNVADGLWDEEVERVFYIWSERDVESWVVDGGCGVEVMDRNTIGTANTLCGY